MNKVVLYSILLSPFLWSIHCGYNWPTKFERVDADRVKILDFVYCNSKNQSLFEFAPGDSVMLYAYFSGKEITDTQWKVSFNVFKPIAGGDTEFDIQDLQYIPFTVDTSEFTEATNIIRLKFKIPETIMYTSKSIKEEYVSLTGMSKEQLLGHIDLMVNTDTSDWNSIPEISQILPTIKIMAPMIMQILTVPARLLVTVNGVVKIKSTFSVRYNRFFREVSGFDNVPVNHNPKVNCIGVYKLKERQHPKFDTQKMVERDTSYCLFLSDTLDTIEIAQNIGRNVQFSDTIVIDTGYTYMVMVDSGVFNGIDQRDTGFLLDQNFITSIAPETMFSQWFYRHDSSEANQVSRDDLMIINSSPNFVSTMDPPKDIRIKSAVLWVQLYDYFTGERLRSSASSLRETKIYFKYTQAYIDKINNK